MPCTKHLPDRDATHHGMNTRNRESTAHVTRSTPHANKNAVSQQGLDLAPAAFPTLSTAEMPTEPEVEHGRHGVWPLVHARQESDQAQLRLLFSRIDNMYDCTIFPTFMSDPEVEWYKELMRRWAHTMASVHTGPQVSQPLYFASCSSQSLLWQNRALTVDATGHV